MSTKAPASPAPAPVDVAKPSALEVFLDQNFRYILYGVLAIVVAGAVYGYLHHRANEAALQAASEATAINSVEDADIIIQKYKGSTAAGNALLTKAKLLWDQNKKDSAVGSLREFTANYKDHPFQVQGLLSLATRLEAMGGNDVKEAQGLYEQIVRDHKNSEIAGLAQMRIADLLWSQGKVDDAKKIYEELPRNFPGQFFEENEKRLKWLAAALPTKEVPAPKVPESLKAPAPGTPPLGAPPLPLDTVPGLDGKSSMPFQIPPPSGSPFGQQPEVKIDLPSSSMPQIKVEPPKPLQGPGATSAPVELKLTPTPKPGPAAPATPPVPAPENKPASTTPPPAPTPAPAAESKPATPPPTPAPPAPAAESKPATPPPAPAPTTPPPEAPKP